MKLQTRRSADQYSEHKKSPGRLHSWKDDRKAGGGAYRHQCSCRVQNQQKRVSFCALGKRSKPQVKRGQRQSASVIAQQLSTATGRQVSRFTVARRLHKGSIFAHRPERCLPLKANHRCYRLQWCREHKN
ncbi:transposable element Tcb2 transposase [Trichonephila clavipes]|nr:transposable element Tcb2 transposase [Trichonephila clavipes]